jgi:hypothetical protein
MTLLEAYREIRQYEEDKRAGRPVSITVKYRYRLAVRLVTIANATS